jgi:hypothetical protein
MQRDLSHPLLAAEIPPGFVIRPLDGAAKMGTYVRALQAVFGTISMTENWRQATLNARTI